MSPKRQFTEREIDFFLGNIGSSLDRRVSVYLIGGAAMSLMGLKDSTKDIDLVFTSTGDVEVFCGAAELSGFHIAPDVSADYRALGAWVIMESEQGLRLDLFDRRVCHGLEIDEGMRGRSRPYKTYDKLAVYLMSPEDIVLFKGVTDREADLDDIRVLAEMGIDWGVVEAECLSQQGSDNWAYMLGTKLLELRDKHRIVAPITRSLMDHADRGLLRRTFAEVMKDRAVTFKEISGEIKGKTGYSESWTRKQLKALIDEGFVKVERRGRRNYYSLK